MTEPAATFEGFPVAALDFTRISALSLIEAHAQLSAMSTIGDLITGSHRQPALAFHDRTHFGIAGHLPQKSEFQRYAHHHL